MSGISIRIFRNARVTAAFIWMMAWFCNLCIVPLLPAQDWDESNKTKHVQIRIPADRQWLGRETANDLERCWGFIDAATGRKLPNRVLVVIHWRDALAAADFERGTITIGMNDPASGTNPRAYLLHAAARELGRMALINLSGGGAAKEENRFLLEGMSEMLAHDFSNTVRRLSAAWTICHYLDLIQPLDLQNLSTRPELAGSIHDLSSASPGITFLTLCRELFGSERTLKLFEYLARKNLDESLTAVFKVPVAGLEAQWLARVRSHDPADVTITTAEEAPALDRITFEPDPGKPGVPLGARLFTRDGTNDLMAAGVFVVDETSGRVLQGRQTVTAGRRATQFEIPIETARQAGRYRMRVVAVDEGGNVRNWEAFYSVAR